MSLECWSVSSQSRLFVTWPSTSAVASTRRLFSGRDVKTCLNARKSRSCLFFRPHHLKQGLEVAIAAVADSIQKIGWINFYPEHEYCAIVFHRADKN